jgi:hypothetical protein
MLGMRRHFKFREGREEFAFLSKSNLSSGVKYGLKERNDRSKLRL